MHQHERYSDKRCYVEEHHDERPPVEGLHEKSLHDERYHEKSDDEPPLCDDQKIGTGMKGTSMKGTSMKSAMKEHDIEQLLVRAVRHRGGMALKFVSPGTNGVPDRLILLPGGKIAFAEMKAPGRTPRPLQCLRIQQITALGFPVYVIDHPDQIGGVLDEVSGT